MLDAGADALASVNGGFNDLTMGLHDYQEFITPIMPRRPLAARAPIAFINARTPRPSWARCLHRLRRPLLPETVDLARPSAGTGKSTFWRERGGLHGRSVMTVGTPAGGGGGCRPFPSPAMAAGSGSAEGARSITASRRRTSWPWHPLPARRPQSASAEGDIIPLFRSGGLTE